VGRGAAPRNLILARIGDGLCSEPCAWVSLACPHYCPHFRDPLVAGSTPWSSRGAGMRSAYHVAEAWLRLRLAPVMCRYQQPSPYVSRASLPPWGSRGREFESRRPDQITATTWRIARSSAFRLDATPWLVGPPRESACQRHAPTQRAAETERPERGGETRYRALPRRRGNHGMNELVRSMYSRYPGRVSASFFSSKGTPETRTRSRVIKAGA
jgi:hypothetical protein